MSNENQTVKKISLAEEISRISEMSDSDWLNALKKAKIYNEEERSLNFNASELAYWLGANKFRTPEETLVQKINGITYEATEAMKVGIRMENYIIQLALSDYNLEKYMEHEWQKYVKRVVSVVNYNGTEYSICIGGRPDAMGSRIIKLENGDLIEEKYVIEVKYMINYSISDFNGEVPPWYLHQCISYMMIFNKDVIFYAIMRDGIFTKILRRTDYIDHAVKMIEDINSFALNLLSRNIAGCANKSGIKKRVVSDKHKILREYVKFVEENADIVKKYNEYNNKKEYYLKKIRDLYEDGEYVLGDKTLKIITKSYHDIDKQKLYENNPELYSAYSINREVKYVFINDTREEIFEDIYEDI